MTTFVAHAGLVLLAPFLPRLFAQLDLVSEAAAGRAQIAPDAAARGVHLLRYLADGRLDAPEGELVLEKLLCGVAPEQALAPPVAIDPADLALCDGLLDAVITQWSAIAGTSRAGLRETFLQRDGRLRHDDDRWSLHIARKSFDMLLDKVPWSVATVFHRWMPQPLHVTW